MEPGSLESGNMKDRVFIIAEMSANHCGQLELAKKIILAARDAGADAVKIQTYTADSLTIDCRKEDFRISSGTLWDDRYLYDLYREAATPWEWQKELKDFAENAGIMLFSTPFDFEAADFLESLNVGAYKIASFEAIDLQLLRYVAAKGKPMLVSTGICSLEEMEDIVDVCHKAGNRDLTLLKCTSSYPAPLTEMNLKTLADMRTRFGPRGVKVGLSDHSLSCIPAVMAVALGASAVEKHFTLDRGLGGPDAAFSFEPAEFADMVAQIRQAEASLGDVNYTVNEKNRRFARSLYTVADIKAGEVFTSENIRSIRPGYGLAPKYYDQILGKKASCDLPFGTALKLEDFA